MKKYKALIITGLLFASFLLSTSAFAKTYYVDPAGNDANSGTATTAAWRTVTKVNSRTYVAGDKILFKKGGTWTNTLAPTTGGTSTAPITYGAYGTGAMPIINGMSTLSNWTSLGGGVWMANCANCGANTMLTMNGVQQPMGRYPNANAANNGYLSYQSHSGTASITDNTQTTTDWTGADVILQSDNWLHRHTITSDTNGVITYSGGTLEPNEDGGYFIENDARTLDQLGEWYVNPANHSVRMYFGSAKPTSYTVMIATTPTLATISKKYVVIDGLAFRGSTANALNISGADHDTVQNSAITFSGTDAITVKHANNFTLKNTTISYSNDAAVIFPAGSASASAVITGNNIDHSGTFGGLGLNNATSYGAIEFADSSVSASATLSNNTIVTTGYPPANGSTGGGGTPSDDTANATKFFAKANSGAAVTIAAEGDSLTYAQQDPTGPVGPINGAVQRRAQYQYPSSLELTLQQSGMNAAVTNRGYPGDSTTQGLSRWASAGATDATVITYGTNDANNYGNHGTVDLATYKTQLTQLIQRRLNQGSWVILCLPPDVASGTGTANIAKYRTVMQQVATQLNIPLFNTQQEISSLGTNLWTDGVHLTAAAYQAWGVNLADTFLQK